MKKGKNGNRKRHKEKDKNSKKDNILIKNKQANLNKIQKGKKSLKREKYLIKIKNKSIPAHFYQIIAKDFTPKAILKISKIRNK